MERLPKVVVVFQFSGNRNQLETALRQFAENRRVEYEAALGSPVELKAKIHRRPDGIYEFYPKFVSAIQPPDETGFAAELRARIEAEVTLRGGIIE